MTDTETGGSDGAEATGRAARDTAALLKRVGDDVSLWDLEVADAVAVNPGSSFDGATRSVPSTGTRRASVSTWYCTATAPARHGPRPCSRARASRPSVRGARSSSTRPPTGTCSPVTTAPSRPGLAMAESLPTPDQAVVVLEVDGVETEQSARARDGRPISVHWLHRDGGDPASSANLVAALQSVELPAGSGHAYLAGELGVVAEMRRTLLARDLAADQISAKPYWRAGVANAPHGEPERQ